MKRLMAVLLLALPASLMAQGNGMGMAKAAPKSKAALITAALSSAPPEIGKEAGVAELTADGKMNVIRESKNGWLCIADQPETPMPDPGCFDKTWQELFGALMAHQPFTPKSTGLSYMLKGGQVASMKIGR